MQSKSPCDLFNQIRYDFIGLNTEYTLADGRRTPRIYLDSTASTLMMGLAHRALNSFYRHYSNTHSLLHFSAKISTREYQWAHDRILDFLQADRETYACFFAGSGTTAGMNRMARVFRDFRPERDTVLISLMEHHSNDLPHRKHAGQVIHLPLDVHNHKPGCIDLQALETELKKNQGRINYVAVTAVSNVTGIINPIYDIAEMAHHYGALILVDGAQAAAHMPVVISNSAHPERNLDAFVFSGHKTYVPGSPGVVVCRKDILNAMEPEEVGGGMVHRVYTEYYTIKDDFPDREEAGTPNIPGAIALGVAIDILDRIGMEFIFAEEMEFIRLALDRLATVPDIHLYGETDCNVCQRAASISFNILGLDHGLVAAALNDYFNIAVRNECFCAHPYVKEMIMGDLAEKALILDEEALLLKQGMVRASFGLYSRESDIEALVIALTDIATHKKKYRKLYVPGEGGNYRHRSFVPETNQYCLRDFIDAALMGDRK